MTIRTTYDFIEQNKRRTWLLVLLFPVTFAAFAYLCLLGFYAISGPSTPQNSPPAYENYYRYTQETGRLQADGLLNQVNKTALVAIPLCWLAAMLWILISYFRGDQMILRSAHAVPIRKEEQPEIYRLVENLCIASGLPVPKIYIMNDDTLNAFATGRDPQHASIALTKGIVQKLERAELEGVIAHELSHVKNRDIRIMLITIAGISFFTLIGETLLYAALRSGRGNSKDNKAQLLLLLLGIVFAVYGYFIAPLLRLAVSRTREYQADATAALMTRNPGALAAALRKISGNSATENLKEHASMAPLYISNPVQNAGIFAALSNLTATHPPIEKRIEALEQMDRANLA